MASEFLQEIARNGEPLPRFRALDIPAKLIWGQYDRYLTAAMADHRRGQLKNAFLTFLPAGHRPQVDDPQQVAGAMLS